MSSSSDTDSDQEWSVLDRIAADFKSPSFLEQNDQQRSEFLQATKEFHPDYAAEIDRIYLEALIESNRYIADQLRYTFTQRDFQIANDLERQLMIDELMRNPAVSQGPSRLSDDTIKLIARQETVDNPDSIFNVMQQVREVFRSQMFNDFSPDKKQQYIDLMLKQPSIIQAGITRDDLLKAYREIEANTAAINRITADPLFVILARLDPKSVLRTCETTQQFRRLCQNPNLFSALMRSHYPNYFETNNPKEQYIAITNGLETVYRMQRARVATDSTEVYWNELENPVQYGKTQLPQNIPGFHLKISEVYDLDQILGPGYVPISLRHLIGQNGEVLWNYIQKAPPGSSVLPEEIPKLLEAKKITPYWIKRGRPKSYRADESKEIVFTIKGYPIPRGTRAWLLIAEGDSTNDETRVFKTKEDLARSFIEKEYPGFEEAIIDEFLDANNEFDLNYDPTREELERMLFSAPKWKTYLQTLQLPYPLTSQTVYNHILGNDHIQADPKYRHNSWFIREVIF